MGNHRSGDGCGYAEGWEGEHEDGSDGRNSRGLLLGRVKRRGGHERYGPLFCGEKSAQMER